MHPLATRRGRRGGVRRHAGRVGIDRLARLVGWPALVVLAPLIVASAPVSGSAPAAPAPAASSGPTLFVPRTADSVVVSDAVPLTVPGRTSITDTLDAEFHRHALEQYQLGQALEAQGLGGSAIAAYRNALRIDPTMRDANYHMGVLFLKNDQLQPALDCFGKEVEHHPDHLDARREFGLTLARMGRGDMAVATLSAMVKANPNDGRSWHALGYAYQAASRPRDAEEALRRSLSIPPEDAEKHRDLGTVLAAMGRDADARHEYERALAMTPIDPSTWYNLGNLERHVGRPDSAIAAYRRAERADSLFRPAWEMETQTLVEAGRRSEAAASYRRWLVQLPYDHGARMNAIRLWTEMDRPDSALEIAREGVRDAGDDAQAVEILGTTLAAQGQWRAALGQLRQAENMFQGDPQRMPALDAVVAHLRANAPDSLHALFAQDSVDTAARRAAYQEMRKHRKPKLDANGN